MTDIGVEETADMHWIMYTLTISTQTCLLSVTNKMFNAVLVNSHILIHKNVKSNLQKSDNFLIITNLFDNVSETYKVLSLLLA